MVVAERQTAGRGRRGRVWQSPARAGIATSVLLRPGGPCRTGLAPAPPTGYGWLPLLAGVALVEAVARLAELEGRRGPQVAERPAVRDAKCAGVLAEAVPGRAPDQPPAIVLGIGLNVTLRADELPVNPTGLPATSLQLAGAVATDRDPLLRALLRAVADWYDRWRRRAAMRWRSGLRDAYLAACATIGREVRVLLPNGDSLTGTATGVDPDGQLMVTTLAGARTLAAGDVLHLR